MDWTRLPLSRAAVGRAAHRRTEPDLLTRLWSDPRTRVLVVAAGALATQDADADADLGAPGPDLDGELDAATLRLFTPAELAATMPDAVPSEAVPSDAVSSEAVPSDVAASDREPGAEGQGPLTLFLGEAPDGAAFLAHVTPEAAPTPGVRWRTLRDVGHALDDRDAGLASTAVGLAAWHERHPRCPRCGATTVPAQAGWIRRCVSDASDHYPRTDPAVIMAVVDADDRLLLGHAVHWPERRFSTLAGFVETGESLESAVRREVAEEVGVAVGDVEYRGSQPWPFPASLMLAYVARALTTELHVDGVEVTEARWFTRPELAQAVADGSVLLPMRTSVARALIEEWFGGRIGGSWA